MSSSGNKLQWCLLNNLSTILTVSNNKKINLELSWRASKKTRVTKERDKSWLNGRNYSNSHRLWSRGLESLVWSKTSSLACTLWWSTTRMTKMELIPTIWPVRKLQTTFSSSSTTSSLSRRTRSRETISPTTSVIATILCSKTSRGAYMTQ